MFRFRNDEGSTHRTPCFFLLPALTVRTFDVCHNETERDGYRRQPGQKTDTFPNKKNDLLFKITTVKQPNNMRNTPLFYYFSSQRQANRD